MLNSSKSWKSISHCGIWLHLCYFTQLISRVLHLDMRQTSDDSLTPSQDPRWTSHLPPLAHQHPCLFFQANSYYHMFWTDTSLANWKEASEKYIMYQQIYLDTDCENTSLRVYSSFPLSPWEVKQSWDILCIPVRKNNWCCVQYHL